MDGSGGAHRAVKAVKTVGGKLQGSFVFGEGVGGSLEFHEHVGEHLARRDTDGFAAVFVLMVGGGAQLGEGFVGFSLGESEPRFGFGNI